MGSLTETPYLSVVVASRNDSHGGDPLARLQALVDTFGAQCSRFGLEAELIVVDWNPPPDRPRLRDAVRVQEPRTLSVRVVEVPPELHSTLPLADALPLFQMIAKNVGIRRARGRFVMSTNIDIIFSNELVEFIAARRLEPGRLYRVDRHDIEAAIPAHATLDAQMAFCARHQLRVHARGGTYRVDSDGAPSAIVDDVVAAPDVSIGAGWHVREGDADCGFYRWATREAHVLVDRTHSAHLTTDAALEIVVEPNPYDPDAWVDLEVIGNGSVLARKRVSRIAGPTTRFCVALADGVERHDVVLRLRDASPDGRMLQPLYERRAGLAYRLVDARLVVIPLRAASAHELPARGPLQARSTGRYHFVWSPSESDTGELSMLDEPTGERVATETRDVHDRGARMSLLSADLRRGDLVWLHADDHGRGVLRGSVPAGELRPGFTPADAARWARVVALRLERAFRRSQRRLRASMVPRLRTWLQRFDPVAPQPAPPSIDDVSGTTAEMLAARDFLRAHRPRQLHQNACGDFQLMARDHWFDLRGFAETATYSMSLDGLLSASADAAGIQEEVLEMPICVYHLEHEKGSGWTPEGETTLRRRLAERGIPWIDARMVHVWSAHMAFLKRPMIFNGSNWGFADAALPETCIRQTTVSDVRHSR